MYFRLFVLLLLVVFVYGKLVDNLFNQSQECVSTYSKPYSCIYFVNRKDLHHKQAATYCFDTFQGALPAIYYSFNEAIEVVAQYFWWSESDMTVDRIRFGEYHRLIHYQPTAINPLIYEIAVDMNIWNRSFPGKIPINLTLENYDHRFPLEDRNFYSHSEVISSEYMTLSPLTMKWSNANYNRTIPFICEVPRYPKVFCEDDWKLYMPTRSCYYFNPDSVNLTFSDANMFCRGMGSNLASMNDEGETEFVAKLLDRHSGWSLKTWIGLRHDYTKPENANAPANRSSPEFGKYFIKHKLGYYIDGTPVNYTRFVEDEQPTWAAGEKCFLLKDGYTKTYHAATCDTKARPLCRKMAVNEPYH